MPSAVRRSTTVVNPPSVPLVEYRLGRTTDVEWKQWVRRPDADVAILCDSHLFSLVLNVPICIKSVISVITVRIMVRRGGKWTLSKKYGVVYIVTVKETTHPTNNTQSFSLPMRCPSTVAEISQSAFSVIDLKFSGWDAADTDLAF